MRKYLPLPLLAALALVAPCALAAPASAQPTTTRYVDNANANATDGSNDCTTAATPCATIQHALDEAGSGDTVSVQPGTYAAGDHLEAGDPHG